MAISSVKVSRGSLDGAVPTVVLIHPDSGEVVTGDNPLPVRLTTDHVTIEGPVTVANEVEVTNDSGNPLPVSGPLTDAQLRATPVPTTETRGISAATITTNTTAVTGTFSAITVLSDAVFTSLTRANTTGSLGATTVPAGVTIFGDITSYQLASGAVIAYGA